jgi:transcriptional regulator with XRE-family HTH domain
MTLVSANIKYLRKKNGFTQEQMAEQIGIKRSLLGAYEEGRADPRLNNLLSMSSVFNVSVDTLISKDVSKLSKEELLAGLITNINNNSKPVDNSTEGGLRVLSITVDKGGRENIELVPQKAAAGYLNGYSDPEFLEELPKFQLPMLTSAGTYRAFEITGDSMLPITPGTIIIGRYVEKVEEIKNGKPYVMVTGKEGIVYKRVFNYITERAKLFLVSDNRIYSPYEIDAADVLEVWEAKAYISFQFPDPEAQNELTLDKLAHMVLNLQQEIIKLKG